MRNYNEQQLQQLKSKSKSLSLPERRGVGSGLDDGAAPSKTNLDRFLNHTTPAVVSQCFPKTSVRGWRNRDSEFHPYFILGDLWDSFWEWSAYGAEVPLVLNGNDSAVQYYVPYLSAMQLYVDPSSSLMEIRKPGEERDTQSSLEANSDESGECEPDRGASNTRGTWNQQNTTGQGNNPGRLIFEHLEQDLPFLREPLADKISILASRFPELRTYRSCDLTLASWICIAWYPIYRLPVGSTLENIDACFLTFHSFATPVWSNSVFDIFASHLCLLCGDHISCVVIVFIVFSYHNKIPLLDTGTDRPQFGVSTINEGLQNEGLQDAGISSKLSLPTYGLTSYKFKVNDWNADGVDECQKFDSLVRGADKWLRLLKVNHPDYIFFESHDSFWRLRLKLVNSELPLALEEYAKFKAWD